MDYFIIWITRLHNLHDWSGWEYYYLYELLLKYVKMLLPTYMIDQSPSPEDLRVLEPFNVAPQRF